MCLEQNRILDPLEQCAICKGVGTHRAIRYMDLPIPVMMREAERRNGFMRAKMNSARTTPVDTLTREPSTSRALGRVRAGVMPWLVARATKFAHPDHQIKVTLSREEEICNVLLSLPEVEAAIRQMMQAYADACNKSMSFCTYPNPSGEQR